MEKTNRQRKKRYTPPRLRRYGDLRTLTQGGTKPKNEAGDTVGPRTKP